MRDSQHIVRRQHSHWRKVSFACLYALLTMLPFAHAQIPYRLTATNPDSSVQRSREFTTSVQTLQSEVTTIESASGPFDRQLLEPLGSLARLHLENEDPQTAESIFEQQLQILRISDGLYSAKQIPIIETLLEVAATANDWQKSNDSLEYLSWLYQRDTSLSPQDKLKGMGKISEWHLIALGKDLSEREAFHLVELAKNENQISKVAEQLYSVNNIEIVPYIYNQALADLYIALAITITDLTSQELILLTEGISNRPNVLSGLSSTSLRTTADVEAMYGSIASTVIERSFRKNMRESFEKLERIKAIYVNEGDVEAEAMASLYLGDSVLMRQQFEHRPSSFAGRRRGTSSAGSAMTHYRDALEKLAASGTEDSVLAAFTACPVLLPLASFESRLQPHTEHCQTASADGTINLGEYKLSSTVIPGIEGTITSEEPRIEASVIFDIQANGQINKKDIITIIPDDTYSRVQVRKLLDITQFRPAMIDGAAVSTQNLRMRISIPSAD